MKVQELLDFLETVNPDADADVVVSVGGRAHTPTISHTLGGDLLLEVPGARSKRPVAKKKRARK